MTTQPRLFGWREETTTVQRPLLDLDSPPVSETTCLECGRQLVETVSGYWSCPAGHGKLLTK